MGRCGRELCRSMGLPAGWGLVSCDAVAFGTAEGRRRKLAGGRGVEAGSGAPDGQAAGQRTSLTAYRCREGDGDGGGDGLSGVNEGGAGVAALGDGGGSGFGGVGAADEPD
uniref:Uncharacterized protein n=1 Tax=Oryza brachyantha TaxID=4533 RepID=J3KW37_ORYBR